MDWTRTSLYYIPASTESNPSELWSDAILYTTCYIQATTLNTCCLTIIPRWLVGKSPYKHWGGMECVVAYGVRCDDGVPGVTTACPGVVTVWARCDDVKPTNGLRAEREMTPADPWATDTLQSIALSSLSSTVQLPSHTRGRHQHSIGIKHVRCGLHSVSF